MGIDVLSAVCRATVIGPTEETARIVRPRSACDVNRFDRTAGPRVKLLPHLDTGNRQLAVGPSLDDRLEQFLKALLDVVRLASFAEGFCEGTQLWMLFKKGPCVRCAEQLVSGVLVEPGTTVGAGQGQPSSAIVLTMISAVRCCRTAGPE